MSQAKNYVRVRGKKLDAVSQRILTYLAEHDDERVVVADMEASDVGTAHQINYRLREHLVPMFVESPGYYELDGAARDRNVWELTRLGANVVNQRGDQFSRPTSLAEVVERLAEVEAVAEESVQSAEDAKGYIDSARSEVSRAKKAADEQVRTMQKTMGSWRRVRDEVAELPTDDDLERVEDLLRRERGRKLSSLESDLNLRVDRLGERVEDNEEDIAELGRELDETQTTLTEWTSYLAAKEERTGGFRGWLRGE